MNHLNKYIKNAILHFVNDKIEVLILFMFSISIPYAIRGYGNSEEALKTIYFYYTVTLLLIYYLICWKHTHDYNQVIVLKKQVDGEFKEKVGEENTIKDIPMFTDKQKEFTLQYFLLTLSFKEYLGKYAVMKVLNVLNIGILLIIIFITPNFITAVVETFLLLLNTYFFWDNMDLFKKIKNVKKNHFMNFFMEKIVFKKGGVYE